MSQKVLLHCAETMYSSYGFVFGLIILLCSHSVLCNPVISDLPILNNENIPLINSVENQTAEIVYLATDRTRESPQENYLVFKIPEAYTSSKEMFLNPDELSATSDEITLRRAARSAEENVIFTLGICKDCHKLLVRDTIMRCSKKGRVSTIVSYDGVSCVDEVNIACVTITDRSDNGDGANIFIKSGAVGKPFLKLNITSFPDKGYHLFLEIRGVDPSEICN